MLNMAEAWNDRPDDPIPAATCLKSGEAVNHATSLIRICLLQRKYGRACITRGLYKMRVQALFQVSNGLEYLVDRRKPPENHATHCCVVAGQCITHGIGWHQAE